MNNQVLIVIPLLGIVFLLGFSLGSVEHSESTFKPSSSYQKLVEQAALIEDLPRESTTNMALLEEFRRIEESLQTETSKDVASPQDWVPVENIKVYEDRVIIAIENPEWAIFTNTKSMDPVIDGTANAIEVVPASPSDIEVGDIVAYKSDYASGTITHRVVGINEDKEGWYATIKGDNNDKADPGRVRFDQILRVVVAIIY